MSDPFVASIRPERNSQNLGVQLEPLHGCAIDLPAHTGVIAVDSFGLGAAQFAFICAWSSTHCAVSFALSFTAHCRPTALNLGALGHGVAASALDAATSCGEC